MALHKIGFITYPAFSTMTFAATSVFELANWKIGSPQYQVTLLSEYGGPIATSLGPEVHTASFKRRAFDTVVIAGDHEAQTATPGLVAYLKLVARRPSRIASICTGAFALAEAGLLDGRQATTHWHFARELQRRYPKVNVLVDRIYTTDGPIWTSAGMSAGVDLALALVQEDLGSDLARAVARLLVVSHRRAGGQSQYSTLLDLDAQSDRVQTVLAYAKQNLASPLSVAKLAEIAFLSPRQFSRLFLQETGHSPAKAVERLRIESAKIMMEAGRFSIEEIARKNGFGNRERMRSSFLRAFGRTPQTIQSEVQNGKDATEQIGEGRTAS